MPQYRDGGSNIDEDIYRFNIGDTERRQVLLKRSHITLPHTTFDVAGLGMPIRSSDDNNNNNNMEGEKEEEGEGDGRAREGEKNCRAAWIRILLEKEESKRKKQGEREMQEGGDRDGDGQLIISHDESFKDETCSDFDEETSKMGEEYIVVVGGYNDMDIHSTSKSHTNDHHCAPLTRGPLRIVLDIPPTYVM